MSPRRRENPLDRAFRFIDDRIGISHFTRKALDKIFPDHWSFMIGEIVNITLFFDAVKTRPKVKDCLQAEANRLAKAGIETPGMDIKEERRAI